jgi:hypothetical protein
LKSFLTYFPNLLFYPLLPLVLLSDGLSERGDDFVACAVLECYCCHNYVSLRCFGRKGTHFLLIIVRFPR